MKWARVSVNQCETCETIFRAKFKERERKYCSPACARRQPWTSERVAAAAARMSSRGLARWADPQTRIEMSEKIRKSHLDPELKATRAASIRQTMSTPEYRARRSAISKSLVSVVFETKKANGSFRESKPEREFVAWLRTVVSGVEHHPRHVDGFDIDVYVAELDTYIQFDGVYYHGLDRPYEQLDNAAKRKFDRDRRADAHFAAKSLRLIRITDREWYAMTSEQDRLAWLHRTRPRIAA